LRTVEHSSYLGRQSSIPGETAPLSQAQSLAVVLPSWIGDTVMATPVLRHLRAARPWAKLIGVMRRGLDEILRGNPWLDEMIVCDMKGVLGPWRVGRTIRKRGADAVLLLPNSLRSAVGARLSGAKFRIVGGC
jgi:heptosyltransferase-2